MDSSQKSDLLIVPFATIEVLDRLVEDLERILGLKTRVYYKKARVDAEYRESRGIQQYLAYDFLNRTVDAMNEMHANYAIGIEQKDFYSPDLNFVFGVASHRLGACVVSLARLRSKQGFASDKHYSDTSEKYYRRVLKEALHELGHGVYGLEHCTMPDCVMRFSNSLAEVDQKDAAFCENCVQVVQKKSKLEQSFA